MHVVVTSGKVCRRCMQTLDRLNKTQSALRESCQMTVREMNGEDQPSASPPQQRLQHVQRIIGGENGKKAMKHRTNKVGESKQLIQPKTEITDRKSIQLQHPSTDSPTALMTGNTTGIGKQKLPPRILPKPEQSISYMLLTPQQCTTSNMALSVTSGSSVNNTSASILTPGNSSNISIQPALQSKPMISGLIESLPHVSPTSPQKPLCSFKADNNIQTIGNNQQGYIKPKPIVSTKTTVASSLFTSNPLVIAPNKLPPMISFKEKSSKSRVSLSLPKVSFKKASEPPTKIRILGQGSPASDPQKTNHSKLRFALKEFNRVKMVLEIFLSVYFCLVFPQICNLIFQMFSLTIRTWIL